MSHKIFRWLWRFNAVVFAFAGTLLIAVLVFALYQIIDRELIHDRRSFELSSSSGNFVEAGTGILGDPDKVRGTDIVVVPLRPGNRLVRPEAGQSTFRHGRTARNLLFIDVRSGQRRWLLPNDQYLIVDFASFPRPFESGSGVPPAKAVIYNVIKSDSNADGRVGPDDLVTVAISNVDGTGYTELISEISTVFGTTSASDRWVVVAYEQNGVTHTATVDLERATVVSAEPTPMLPAQ
jgi:hypothetical protein